MNISAEELCHLGRLNQERKPLQKKLEDRAADLFELWNKLTPLPVTFCSRGSRIFKNVECSPTVAGTEQLITFQFEHCCDMCEDYEEGSFVLPASAFWDDSWASEARRELQSLEVQES